MSSSKTSSRGVLSSLNPKTTEYEFLGPPGALLISFGLPFVTYSLFFGCSESSTCIPASWTAIPSRLLQSLLDINWLGQALWDWDAMKVYAGWYAFCVLAWIVLPGEWIEGTVLRNGERKKYKINAFATWILALGIITAWIAYHGPEGFTFVYHHYPGLVTASVVNAFLQACWCYASSYRSGALLALGGNSGNVLYDWFIGRELNPSIGSFDLKSFNELRPGLMLWVLIDISMLCEQAVRLGGLANVTDSMWLVLAFHGWYVTDSLWHETSVFTTMDIISDGFGFMLSIGDLCWVPFAYSLQARFLAFHPVSLGVFNTLAIVAVNALGYWIFRDSNSEKNIFRNGQNPRGLKFMQTKRGTKLLTSGWWGMCQHPNYLGDWLMSLAWSMPTGLHTPLTYWFPVYFAILLLHRQMRDDEACSKKYGDDWVAYKKLVPYKIVPYVY